MRRRFNHNQQLLKELYGRNFSLKSLLNEANLKDDQDSIRRLVSAYIKFVDKNESTIDKVMNDRSFKKILAQVEKAGHSNDEIVRFLKVFDQVRESEPDQNLNQKQRTDLTNKAIAQFGAGSKNKAQGKPETLSSTKKDDKPQQKKTPSANAKVKELQELIGHNPANGIWKGTDKTWVEWVEANKDGIPSEMPDDNETIELIKTSWKKAAAKSNGVYTGNIDGMLKFVKDFTSETTSEPNTGESEQEPEKEKSKSNTSKFSYVTNENEVYEAIKKATLTRRTVGDKSNAGNLLGKISMSAFKGSGEKGGTEYDTPEEYLKSDTGTAEYFHKDGRTRSSNYDLYLRREGDLDDERKIPTFTVFVDGSLKYNATIKGYVVVKIDGKLFAVHKSKTASVLKESNLHTHKGMLLGESRGSLYRKRYFGRY